MANIERKRALAYAIAEDLIEYCCIDGARTASGKFKHIRKDAVLVTRVARRIQETLEHFADSNSPNLDESEETRG